MQLHTLLTTPASASVKPCSWQPPTPAASQANAVLSTPAHPPTSYVFAGSKVAPLSRSKTSSCRGRVGYEMLLTPPGLNLEKDSFPEEENGRQKADQYIAQRIQQRAECWTDNG